MYGLLWAAFLFVAVYISFFSPFLRVDTVRVEGIVSLSSQEIAQFVRDDISRKYLGFIPVDNLFLLPRERIESDIAEHFKKIRFVDVSTEFPRTLSVLVQERKSLAFWCSGENCFHVDEEGYAYAEADLSQDLRYSEEFLRINDTGSQSVDMNEPILDEDFIVFISNIRKSLRDDLNMEVSSDCSTPSRFSDQITLKTSEGWLLHIDVRLPIGESLHTLRSVLQKEISQERRQRLKYIDLRTEHRVYYSVEGETVSAPPEEEDATVPASELTTTPSSEETPQSSKKK